MANNDSQIMGFELRQHGLPNASLMRLLYDCGGIISIPELNMNINLKGIPNTFSEDLIPNLIRKSLNNLGSKPYIDVSFFRYIVNKIYLLTGKNYNFKHNTNINQGITTNKFNISIPAIWYIELALDASLVSYCHSLIWLKDNNYQGINEKRGIADAKVENIRTMISSPQREEEARKWREFAQTQAGQKQRAALCAAQKWEGAIHIQIYDGIYPNKTGNSPATKNTTISRLLREAKKLAEKNSPLKTCWNK